MHWWHVERLAENATSLLHFYCQFIMLVVSITVSVLDQFVVDLVSNVLVVQQIHNKSNRV